MISNNENNNSKLTWIGLGGFYLICIIFIVIFAGDWWDKKETFYVTESNVTMLVNGKYQVGVYGKTEAKNSDSYSYSSSNEGIIKVDSSGVVTAISEGEAEVTVKSKYSKKENKILFNVSGTEIYSIDIENERMSLKKGSKSSLAVVVNEDNNFKPELKYYSNNSSIVTVSSTGVISAKGVGTAYITVESPDGSISAKAEVTVTGTNTSSKPSKTSNSNKPTKPTQPTKPTTPTKPIPVIEDDEDPSGGDDTPINTNVNVVSVSLRLGANSIYVGKTTNATVTINPSTATNKKVTFKSSNPNVATVSATGVVTGIREGTANIIVTTSNGNKTSFATIKVVEQKVAPTGINLSKTSSTIEVGGSDTVTATVLPNNANNKNVVWTSSNASVATVNNGVIKGVKVGTATITAKTSNGIAKNITVSVTAKRVAVTGISLNTKSMNLSKGSSAKLTATVSPSNATNKGVTWTSSKPGVVTVDSNGNIKAVAVGSATITAKTSDGGKTASATITVPEVKITSITLKASSKVVTKGSTYAIVSTISPNNATNKTLSYTSSNTGVATVDASGKVTAKSLGTATISVKATDGSGKVAKIKIVVSPNGSVIDVRGKTYKVYKKNINVATSSSASAKHMQNFVISKLGTTDEVIYLTTVTSGNKKKSSLTSSDINDLNRTIVFKVKASNIKNDAKRVSSTIMYLKKAGHGQGVDLESDSGSTFWLTSDGTGTRESPKGTWWGKSFGVMRIGFKAIKKDAAYTPLRKVNLKDSSGNKIAGLTPFVDSANDLIGLKYSNVIKIYKLSDLKNGKYTELYSLKYSSAYSTYSDGVKIYSQGVDMSNGYIYFYLGTPGRKAYIEVFNLLGERVYGTAVETGSTAGDYSKVKRESEGIHIYNNKVYVGSTHKISGKSGSYMDIGYYK